MNGISAPKKETPESSFCHFCHVRVQQEDSVYELWNLALRHWISQHLDLRLASSRLWEINCCLKPLSLWYSVKAAKTDEDRNRLYFSPASGQPCDFETAFSQLLKMGLTRSLNSGPEGKMDMVNIRIIQDGPLLWSEAKR